VAQYQRSCHEVPPGFVVARGGVGSCGLSF
jgi:hypothetical protein